MNKPHNLAPDWRPREDDELHAKSRGIGPKQFRDLADSFVEYFTNSKKGLKAERVDWSLTFKKQWLNKARPWDNGDRWPEDIQIPLAQAMEGPRRAIPVPRVRRMPGPSRPLSEAQRRAMVQEIMAAEQEKKREPIKPHHVPMPDEWWLKWGVEPPKKHG